MSRRAERRRGYVVGAAGVIGVALGVVQAPWLDAHLSGPRAPDLGRYTIIVPGGRDGVINTVATGSGIVDGSLTLITREFGRKDLLAAHTAAPVARFELDLEPTSAPVTASVREESGTISQLLDFGPGGWASASNRPPQSWAVPGRASVEVRGGRVLADGVGAGPGAVGQLELRPGGVVRIEALRAWGADGTLLLDDSFRATHASATTRLIFGILSGTVVTMLAFVTASARSGLGGALAVGLGLGPPIAVLGTRYATIRATIERLYLGTTDPGALRAMLLFGSLLPLLAMTLLASRVLVVREGKAARTGLWVGLMIMAGLVASRGFVGWDFVWLVPALLVLALPLWGARRAGQSTHAVFLRELPVLAAVAVLGWGPGLLLGTLLRLLSIAANAEFYATSAAAVGVDLLVLNSLMLVPATEAALRWTGAGEVWRPESLAGASLGLGADAAAEFLPFWTGDCGPAVIDVFGGSSTGGAYQFRSSPTAFFPARLHESLCAEGYGVRTHNFGNSGRDTWDAAHAAPDLFASEAPAVVVVYAGVNDLLTADAPLTRKQQAKAFAARSTAVGLLSRLGESSRLITGFTLWNRPRAQGQLVPAVPLADAEENLRLLASATLAAHGTLVLVPEIVMTRQAADMAEYVAMERRIAAALPGVSFVDPGADWDPFLVDRNHLSEEGAIRLAALVRPAVKAALDRRRSGPPQRRE